MINNMKNKNNLYDWLFHYNHIQNLWTAFKREDSIDYFNGKLVNKITSKKHSTLVDIILKTNGDKALIKKMIHE
jgi:hypothetical protein